MEGLRLTIATLRVPSLDVCHGVGCALIAWCASARRLVAALPPSWSVQLLAVVAASQPSALNPRREVRCRGGVLSSETEEFDARDCPELLLVTPTPALVSAVEHYTRRRRAQLLALGRRTAFFDRLASTLYKWECVRLAAEGDALLFTDLDVDILPTSLDAASVGREWAKELPPLIARSRDPLKPLWMVGSADATSVLNAGVLLLMTPPGAGRQLYQAGITVLHSPFNDSHGWNLSGPPAALFAKVPLRRVDGSAAPRFWGRAGEAPPSKRHSWDFVSADQESGLFVHMLLWRYRVGAYAALARSHRLAHHMGLEGKPWAIALRADARAPCHVGHWSAYLYLRSLRLPAASANSSVCACAFRRKLVELEEGNVTRCAALLRRRAPSSRGEVGEGDGAELSRQLASTFRGLYFRPF